MSQASSQYPQSLHHVTSTSPAYKTYEDSRQTYQESSNVYREEPSNPYHSRNETYQQAYYVPEDRSYVDEERQTADGSPTLGQLDHQGRRSEEMAARQAFFIALENFQQAYHPPTPSSKHRRLAGEPNAESNDMTLNAILAHIQPTLGQVGLSVRWEDLTLAEDSVGVRCIVSHRSGEERGCRMVLPLSSLPEKMYVRESYHSPSNFPAQEHSTENLSGKETTERHIIRESARESAIASAMTFVKRYTLSSILGLWGSEDTSLQVPYSQESLSPSSYAASKSSPQSTLRQPSSQKPSVQFEPFAQSKKSAPHKPPLKSRRQQGTIYTRRSQLRTHEEGFSHRNIPESPILILRDSGRCKNTAKREDIGEDAEENNRGRVFYARIVKLYKQRLRSLMDLGFRGRAINKFIAFEDFIEYGEPSVEEIIYQGRILSGLLAQKVHEQKSANASSTPTPKHVSPDSSIHTAPHRTKKLAPQHDTRLSVPPQRVRSSAFAGVSESRREFGKGARGRLARKER